ncbi:MAG: hypothetical protein LUD27_00595 [Clostridia bacterium]|nr:hypothetical protein [Clostridia bacterium]
MDLNTFRREFKHCGGVMLTSSVCMFRRPLELYDREKKETLAQFKYKDYESAFAFDLGGKTVGETIASWEHMPIVTLNGGRGGDSGSFSEAWKLEGGRGGANLPSKADFPARMNVKTGAVSNSYDKMLSAFIQTHAADETEHGITVDEYGFTTRYMHGDKGSVSISGSVGEIIVHNHPFDGWPNFSKDDIAVITNSAAKGVVAVSSTTGRSADTAKYAGTYSFVKTAKFNANGFLKALDTAHISGKDYNDAVSKWLKANQKKYGYIYTYTK